MLVVSTTTVAALLTAAVRVSLPSPPVRLSKAERLLEVEASKVSAPPAPVRVSAPVVRVRVCGAVAGSESSLVMVPVAETEALSVEPENVTVKVSSVSKVVSSVVVMLTNLVC